MAKSTRLFLTSIVLFGAFALFAQVILLREFLVIFYGNEICLGLIFCCWLFWIAVGAWGARRIAHLFDPAKSLRIWIVSLTLLPLFLPVQIGTVRVLRGILQIPAGQWISFFAMLLSVLTILAPVGFLIGLSFPAVCRVLPEEGNGAVSIGRVYIYEAAGSLIGGAALTYYLIDRLDPFSISALGGTALIFSTLPLIQGLPRRQKVFFMPLILLTATSQVTLFAFGRDVHDYFIAKRWESFRHREELKVSVDTRYQNIAVGYSRGQYSLYGNGLWSYSFPDEYTFAALAHLTLSEHPNPSSVLLIGGGEGGLIRELLKHPIQELSYVELDPNVIKTMEDYLPAEDREALRDPRIALHFEDGRYFVKHTSDRYDAVLVNLPDPSTAMLNRYYTLDFFEEIKKILNPGGMVFLSLTSTGNFAGGDIVSYGRSVYRTLKTVFPYVVVAPGPPQSFFASAFPAVVTSDPEVLSRRFAARKVETQAFSSFLFEQIFPEERVGALQGILEQEGKEKLNTDLYPVTYFYNLILWGRYSGSSIAGLLGFLAEIHPLWICTPLVLLLILKGTGYFFRSRRLSRSKSSLSPFLFTIGTTGFYGLSMEIIILFLFQNLYGYVYQKVGLIVALFMFGLALGGTAANGILKTGRRTFLSCLAVSETAIICIAFVVPWMLEVSKTLAVSADRILYAAVVMIGLTAGFQFPMVSAVCMTNGITQAQTAASIDSRDHLGACLGALVTGVLLVPLLGIPASCYLIGGIKGVSLIGLFLRRQG